MKKMNKIIQKIKINTDNNSILGKSKLPKSFNYKLKKYSVLAYDKLEKEQGPTLKKTRK